MTRKIRVVVVDDSAVMRRALSQSLGREPDIEVVATAADPYIARERILRLDPDVLTLDVEMPAMDGLTFLEKLMRRRPMPVVMVSSYTESGSELTLRALELGAVNFVSKPSLGDPTELAAEIAEKVREAAQARIQRKPPAVAALPRRPAPGRVSPAPAADQIIVIGASAGGTDAIRETLVQMPVDSPGILIVQHMPERFTHAFATRCDMQCAISVKEAAHGDRVLRGQALIARGNHHLRLAADAAGYYVRLGQDPPCNRHRPSVDVLFESVARVAASGAVGVILTGMGADGARGLRAMRHAGARTVAQDEASCVVYGMPKEAVALGAAEFVLPLPKIAAAVLQLSEGRRRVDAGATRSIDALDD